MAKTTPMFERSHVRFLLASLLLLLPPAEARGQAAALQDIAPEPVAPYTTNPGSIIRITRWADAPMALLMLYGIEHANRESLVEIDTSLPEARPCRDDGLGQAEMLAGGAWTEARQPRP